MRTRLGDLVPMPDGSEVPYVAPPLVPMIPGLPADLASNFLSTMTPGQQTVPAYAIDTDTPVLDRYVTDGPGFVPAMPGGNIPQATRGLPVWTRTPILPDSVLPDPLKRDAWLRQSPVYTANPWDAQILHEADVWAYIASHGGLKSFCRIPELGAPIYSYPPWQVMPSNGIRFNKMFFQPIGSVSGGTPFDGLDTVLGSFRVELGFDGAITHFLCGFTGNGFDDGSGNITWRLEIGQRFAKTLGNVTFTYGSLQTALTIPGSSWRLVSGQTVQLIANIPNLSPVSGGQVFAGVLGWTYPRR